MAKLWRRHVARRAEKPLGGVRPVIGVYTTTESERRVAVELLGDGGHVYFLTLDAGEARSMAQSLARHADGLEEMERASGTRRARMVCAECGDGGADPCDVCGRVVCGYHSRTIDGQNLCQRCQEAA